MTRLQVRLAHALREAYPELRVVGQEDRQATRITYADPDDLEAARRQWVVCVGAVAAIAVPVTRTTAPGRLDFLLECGFNQFLTRRFCARCGKPLRDGERETCC